jgi:transposase InsO family protein
MPQEGEFAMPWSVKDKVKLRLEFVSRAQSGEKISRLCREFGISRPTGYLWINRYRECGSVNELFDRSHRPVISPNKIPSDLEEKICSLREKYGWGGRKLRCLLEREAIEASVTTINRVIKRNGLLAAEDCHRPAPLRFERSKPNELWQADFKGPMGKGNAQCEPLSVIDDHSRYVVGLVAVQSKQTPEVTKAFTRIFEENGVPEALLLDHGVPWWSTSHYLGFSRFSVWLMKQNLKLIFSAINHPQTQGKVERFHRSLALSVATKGTPRNFSQWKKLLHEIRREFNHIRPHEALDMRVPKSRYKLCRKPFNPKPAPFQYPERATVVRLDSTGQFRHKKLRGFVSQSLSGEYVMLQELESSIVVYYRNSMVREVSLSGKSSFISPKDAWRHIPPWGDA